MNTATDITRGGQQKLSKETREQETPAMIPPVDIFEDKNGITLLMDLPGVARDRLDIQVDDDTLSIEGEAAIDMPEGMQPLHADVRATRYRRRFTLSRELAMDRISASMTDGVLTVKIPKREELQPRKIEINAA